MNHENKTPKIFMWTMMVCGGIGVVAMIVAMIVFALSGHPFFVFVLWSFLGAGVGSGLKFLVRRATSSRRSYWTLIAPIYVLMLLVGIALFILFPDWIMGNAGDAPNIPIPGPPGIAGFYAGFLASPSTAKQVLRRPEDSGASL